MHSLVEMWAWDKRDAELRDRSLSPWDCIDRRPSHADRRNALRRTCFHNELSAVQRKHHIHPPIKKLLKTFLSLAA